MLSAKNEHSILENQLHSMKNIYIMRLSRKRKIPCISQPVLHCLWSCGKDNLALFQIIHVVQYLIRKMITERLISMFFWLKVVKCIGVIK